MIHTKNNSDPRAAENLPAKSARARIRATAFMVVRWSNMQLWTEHREMDKLKSVEQIPRVFTQRSRLAVPSLTWGDLRLLLAPGSANAVFYSVSVAILACVACVYVCWRVGVRAVVLVTMMMMMMAVCRSSCLSLRNCATKSLSKFQQFACRACFFVRQTFFCCSSRGPYFINKPKDEFSLNSLLLWLKISR